MWDNVKFLSSNENLIVTGDYSNWMFDKPFTPNATTEKISDYYWCEKVQLSSTQDPFDFDDDATKKALEEGINGGIEEYGYEDDRLEEMIQYYEDCLCHLDCKEVYLAYAHDNLPRFCDHEDVVYFNKVKPQLQVVFDAFEEICRRLKEIEDRELERESESDEVIGTTGVLVDYLKENLTEEEWNAISVVHCLKNRLDLGIRFDWSRSIDVRGCGTSQIVDENVFLQLEVWQCKSR